MRVSVIIPAYNRADLLPRTLQSVLAQTHPPAQLIVVDDGSTDSTAEVARSFPEVHLISQVNAGLGAARNAGAVVADGDALLFLDSDDLLAPTALAALEQKLQENPEALAAYCRSALIDENDALTMACWDESDAEGWIWERLIRSNCIRSPGCVLLRKSAWEKIGPWTTQKAKGGHEDWDLWLRLAEHGPFARVTEPLFLYRVHSSGMSQNHLKMHRSAYAVLKDQEAHWKRDPKRRAVVQEIRQICAQGTAHLLCQDARCAWEASDFPTTMALLREAVTYDADVWKLVGPRTETPLRLRHLLLYPLTKILPTPPPPRDVPLLPRPLAKMQHPEDAPRVSVVIPAYAHRDYILQAIDSVQAQSFPQNQIEIIVVNDGSPDDTEAILEPLIAAGTIRYIRQKNAGQGAARNQGIALARGEFIALLDDDDHFPPEKLTRHVALMEAHPEVAVVYGPAQPIDMQNQPIEPRDWYGQLLPWPWECPSGNLWAELVTRNWLVTPGQSLIRKAALDALGETAFDPDPTIKGCDDWDLFLRLAESFAFHFDPQIALHYRFHPRNASQDTLKMRQAALALYDKHAVRHATDLPRKALLTHWRQLFAQSTPAYLLDQARHDRASGDLRTCLRKLGYILKNQPRLLLTRENAKFALVTLWRARNPDSASAQDKSWAQQREADPGSS